MENLIRIYADANDRDEQGRFELGIVGSLADIKKYEGLLADGMVVLLNVQDEFEVEGTLIFDQIWRAIPNFETLHYLNPEDEF